MIESIKTVGVVGAGTMGAGIAQVCATAGYRTLLFDVNGALLNNAKLAIGQNLDAAIEKGKLTASAKTDVLGKIVLQSSISDLKADLIIEAVVEKLEVKQELFKALEKANSPQCILATNTSSIPITQIAAGLTRPEQCVGLHFFNPAPVMKLVEVIAGVATDKSVAAAMVEFTKSLGKVPVVASDSPGFIVNRVARHFYVESLKILEENVASAEEIDALMRSAGFKMGPFELMDLIGVDTNFSVTSSMYHSFHQDPKFRPSRIQHQKVLAGHFGRKSGRGFYDYSKR